jgi:hypothetical protein
MKQRHTAACRAAHRCACWFGSCRREALEQLSLHPLMRA